MRKKIPLAVWVGGVILLVVLLSAGRNKAAAGGDFSGERAYSQAEYMTTKIGPRPPGSKGEIAAGDYIATRLKADGWQVAYQEFAQAALEDRGSLKKYSLINSRNIIAVKPGLSSRTVLVGAHYDSADFNVPGADDNASGVGVLLEIGRELSLHPQQETYILVAFGAEEAGLLGSRYFADNYDLNQVDLMLNLDMVGEGSKLALDGGGKISTAPKLLQTAFALSRRSGLRPEVKRDMMLLARESEMGGSSDFSSFLDKGIAAIGLGQGGAVPVYYHQPTDTLAHVNPATLGKVGSVVLALLAWHESQPSQTAWNTLYLTLVTPVGLLILPAFVLKGTVISTLILAVAVLIKRRRRAWLRLIWVVPLMFCLTFGAVLLSSIPEKLIGLAKGLSEPWFNHALLYLVLRIVTTALIGAVALQLLSKLLPKLLPPLRDLYWAGSIVLLSVATVTLAFYRWDFAAYLGFWLLFTCISSYKYGLIALFVAPLPIYSLHWQIFNSQLGSEFYRLLNRHPVILSLVYALAALPLVLALFAVKLPAKVHSRLVSAVLLMYLGTLLAAAAFPAYTTAKPQAITVRQEWQDRKLMLQAISPDTLPAGMRKALAVKQNVKTAAISISGGTEPPQPKVDVQAVPLNKERLLTVDIQMPPGDDSYLIKIKLRSEQGFTLVNGGSFFPLGKLAHKVKLSGVPVAGVYGLILERTPPQPKHFQLYLRSSGPVLFSLERQYQAQFSPRTYVLPNTVIKYENWCSSVQEL